MASSRAADPSAPLAGVRLLELSRVISGPYIGRLLADLGADVIKIEPPSGDDAREIAPKHDVGMSAGFTFANVGKRSLSVDLREPGAAALVLAIAERCDAVTENFRPGVLDRLGLGWEAIHAANPRTILVSINGYGSDSVWSDRRAYAPIMHAVTGILHDQASYAGQPVAQLNDAHADTLTALHATVALLAALRLADATGRGQWVEVPMFDAVLTTYSEVGNALLDPPDDRVMNPVFDAGPNGSVAVAGPVHYVWSLFSRANPDISDPAPEGADRDTRMRLRRKALAEWMARRPGPEPLVARLEAAGLACAIVQPLCQAVEGPLARERDLLVHVDDRRGGARPVVGPAARFSESSHGIRGAAPLRGEHGAEILREVLGYDEGRIGELVASGVVLPGASGPERDS